MRDFIHLHVHTQYSLLDGQASIPRLVDKAIANGMRGMAVTDHGNMMGIKEFFNYTQGVRSKASKAIRALEAKIAAIDAGEFAPEAGSADAGKPLPQLRAEAEAEIAKKRTAAEFMPIFGCEMYVARRGDKSLRTERDDRSGWHLVVLAKNELGYHNLVKLVSRSWVDGFYMRPRTDFADIERYHEGLIVCSACLGGEVPQKIMAGDIAGAEETVRRYKALFGDDYYLEIQRHEVKDPSIRANRETFKEQQRVNPVVIDLARRCGVKLVCTNDSHFVDEENGEAHDRLICLATGRDLDDPQRMLYTKQEWFKTREEMNAIFADVPEALDGTIDVLGKIEIYSIDHAPIMPNFDIPADFGTEEGYRERFSQEDLYNEFTQDEVGRVVLSREEGEEKIRKLGGYDKLYRIKLEADYLSLLAYEGAKKRYGEVLDDVTKERINFELHIMKTMGFPGYFLIVQDYIRAAREELDVSVGPGRGSAAGSAVAYCLGITQVDPIKYDLLFERFLNPDRISLPDIDVDFDDDGRGRVLSWVTQKYHPENCAHIITYGTMATKTAIKDVARVEKLPLSMSNRLCKLIPDKLPEGPDGKAPKLNLKNAIAAIPELREAEASTDPVLHDTIRYAKMLEGNVRNTGVHACGFIICRDEISDWVPVSTAEDKETGEKVAVTQYEGRVIEDTGLIKMDFLGRKTLSIIRESLGIELDIDRISIEDPSTYQLYCDGRTIGTFQFESAGMQKYLIELQPATFEDLIAMNALYRPGPMQYIPQFIRRKQGVDPITYDLPCMEKYLKDTYGITVYQEQVMLLSREIADFTRGESDALRKAMGKKLVDKLNHMYPKFIEGGIKNGHPKEALEKIWEDWRAFASYAFNKSHATCYSWVAYQTAYLKANYPAQYMAGVMSRSLADIKTITKLMDECKALGIDTLGPDVNESRLKFSVNHLGSIRFGLGAIKGVGEAAVEAIEQERKRGGAYKDIYDFVERINMSVVNKKCLENMALAGAFDGVSGLSREQFVEPDAERLTFIDHLVRYSQRYHADKLSNANSLFGDMEEVSIAKPQPPTDFKRWSDLEKLNHERDLIGIYISGHPLDEYALVLGTLCNMKVTDLEDVAPFAAQDAAVGGMVTDVRTGTTKTGKPYGIVKLEDFSGSGELALFGDDWGRWSGYLVAGTSVLIRGRVEPKRFRNDEFELRIGRIDFLSDVKDTSINRITLHVKSGLLTEQTAHDVASMLSRADEGSTSVFFSFDVPGQTAPLKMQAPSLHINIDRHLIEYIGSLPELTYSLN